MTQVDPIETATLSFRAIHAALADDPKTREPMNALTVWTELGRGLAGTLEKKGASPGLLREIIAEYCHHRANDATADLNRWAYLIPPEERLTQKEVALAMRRVMSALEARMPELAAQAETATDKERELYMAVVRGWFPVGLDIVRALPRGAASDEGERLAALGAWCERFLPAETAAARDLGVRVARE